MKIFKLNADKLYETTRRFCFPISIVVAVERGNA